MEGPLSETVVPVRGRMAWLLASVPAALAAGALSAVQLAQNPAGNAVGIVFYFGWSILVVGFVLRVRLSGLPAMVLDGAGVRLPYVRVEVPWADLTRAEVRHGGQELRLRVRDGGGVRRARGDDPAEPPRSSHLRVLQLLVGAPFRVVTDLMASRGVAVDHPDVRQRTTLLERMAVGEGLVLLLFSSHKGHLLYQQVYFTAGFVVAALAFLDRRSLDLAMVGLIVANVALIAFVLLHGGPSALVRAGALFTFTLSLGSMLGAVDWRVRPAP